MIVHVSRGGLAILDVPNNHKKHLLTHDCDILAKIVGGIGYLRSLLMVGFPSAVLFLGGFIAGTVAFIHYQEMHMMLTGPTMISGVLMVMGMLLLVAGFILNSLAIIMKSGV